ncbi:MAG: peptide deformylase [Candidatus Magasanikbacteria bacterium]
MFKIVALPTESLRQRSTEIDEGFLSSKEIQTLIKDMYPTMHAADGIGLAAPQIEKNIRICTIGKDAIEDDHEIWTQIESEKRDICLVNPVWERTSRKKTTDVEGCLSVPGKTGTVKRYKYIHVEALSGTGKMLSFGASDYFARVIQHEVDHLDGILFIDKAKDIEEISNI